MSRILSGVQPSGTLHLGNYYGMIKPMIDFQDQNELYLFVANYHAMTTIHTADELKKLTQEVVLDLLALGVNPDKTAFWIQSDIPEVTELSWILSCITPMGLLERAHSYKDKVAKGILPSMGLFNYPLLMAADILLFQSELVPVGKDQKQHLEMARDIAEKFNAQYGEVFTLPEPHIQEVVAVVPGIDGQKMSKSYGNIIPLFGQSADIKKIIMKIVTDSKGVDEAKDPDTCTIFKLYSLMASHDEITNLRHRYLSGGMGYGEAKTLLFEKHQEIFSPLQKCREEYEKTPELITKILLDGATKARVFAKATMDEIRKKTGLKF